MTSYEFVGKHEVYRKICLWAKSREQIALAWSALRKQMAPEADITEVVLWAAPETQVNTPHSLESLALRRRHTTLIQFEAGAGEIIFYVIEINVIV